MSSENRNKKTLLIVTVVPLIMLGAAFAAVPIYDTFCRVTGYGGATQTAESNDSEVLDREITVRFDSTVNSELPWDFKPEQRSMTVKVGENGLAFYQATNTADYPVVGTATYNVTPMKAGPYFSKLECFCFTEQVLQPGETMTMPVVFFLDPQIEEDATLDDVREVTLSYTFFRQKDQSAAQGRAALN